MTNEKLNVPELRFPGFEGEWEEKTLNEIIDVRSGKDYKHLNKGNYPVYGTGGYMLSVDNYLYEKDAIGIGRKGTINKPYLLKGPFWTVDTLFYCIPKNSNTYFMLCLFKNINWKIYDESTGVPSLSKITINKIKKSLPSINEQQKIGDFFSKLDCQIELEEQKLEKLEQQKKGYMQKIFSQQLRFKDENGNQYPDWEEDELKNLGETFSGLSGKTKDDFGHGNAEFITYMNVFKNIIANENMTEKVYISNNERQSNVQYNDILFTTSSEVPNEVGMSSIWLYNKKNVYLNSFCFGFRVLDNRINPVFLTRFLRSDNMRKIITILAQGSTRFNISKKEIMKLPIKIPLLNEQNKIKDFLLTIEKAVNTQSEKINKLKTRKKALLQKMFV